MVHNNSLRPDANSGGRGVKIHFRENWNHMTKFISSEAHYVFKFIVVIRFI